MEIVVIDGQGGGIGKNIIQVLKEKHPEYTIIGVGTNSMATTQLKKGGADIIATGENAVVYNVKHASIVVGPIGVAFANSMYGEITPAMAKAIGESEARKYFIPVSKCSAQVVGVASKSISEYIDDLVVMIEKLEKKGWSLQSEMDEEEWAEIVYRKAQILTRLQEETR